jgi:hypothetical protein
MSASAVRANARERAEKPAPEKPIVPNAGLDAAESSSCEFIGLNTRCGPAYADHP